MPSNSARRRAEAHPTLRKFHAVKFGSQTAEAHLTLKKFHARDGVIFRPVLIIIHTPACGMYYAGKKYTHRSPTSKRGMGSERREKLIGVIRPRAKFLRPAERLARSAAVKEIAGLHENSFPGK